LEDVGGAAYVAWLVDGVPISTNVPHYAAIVKEKAARRALIAAAQRVLDRAYAGADPVEEIADGGAAEIETTRRHLGAGRRGDFDLEFFTLAEIAQRVADRGPRRFLLRGIWPAGDYGVMAAEMKAQKTMNAVDMAVSVASGTPWLNHVPVDAVGSVVMFAGEGGEGGILRRARGIALERGLDADVLPITVCTRVPHLNDANHLRRMEREIGQRKPVLVIVDPLYLAARNANGSDLYAMGAMLEDIQHLCQRYSASLLVVTHFNRKPGQGKGRISGAGPAEWGRVLLSSTVKSRHADAATKETTVLTEMEIIGGEIPDQALRILRRVRAENPDDLDSPLYIHTTVVTGVADSVTEGVNTPVKLKPAHAKILAGLRAAPGEVSQQGLADWVGKQYGDGFCRETVSRGLNDLAKLGLVQTVGEAGRFQPKLWKLLPCADGLV
jgi:hypothetical protein